MSAERSPEPGDIIRLSLAPTVGAEQGGFRPALVLSSAGYDSLSGRALVMPVSSRVRGWATKIPLPPDSSVHGVVLADQTRMIDWRARRIEYVGTAPQTALKAARDRLLVLMERA